MEPTSAPPAESKTKSGQSQEKPLYQPTDMEVFRKHANYVPPHLQPKGRGLTRREMRANYIPPGGFPEEPSGSTTSDAQTTRPPLTVPSPKGLSAPLPTARPAKSNKPSLLAEDYEGE